MHGTINIKYTERIMCCINVTLHVSAANHGYGYLPKKIVGTHDPKLKRTVFKVAVQLFFKENLTLYDLLTCFG